MRQHKQARLPACRAVLKVKQKQQADRNFSLALLHDLQLLCLQYVVDTQRTTDDSDPSQDILDELCPGDSAEDDPDIDTSQPEVCTSEYYTATPHSLVKGHINLTLKDARLLRSFIAASAEVHGRG